MKAPSRPAGCGGCPLNRRQFLSGCASCVGALGWFTAPGWLRAAPSPRPRIRVVYALHADQQPGPDWPNVGFDFVPVMQRLTNTLVAGCPELEFVVAQAAGEAQAKQLLEADENAGIDGYVVFQLNCWNRVVQTVAASGKPVLYADFQFGGSGGFLVYNAAFLRARTPNVGFVASSDPEDLVRAARAFRLLARGATPTEFVAATAQARRGNTPAAGDRDCLPDDLDPLSAPDCLERLKASRILAVRGTEAGPAEPIMGIPMEWVSFAEVNRAWEAADRDEARAVADRWQENAAAVKDVSRETLEASAAMYLAQKAVLRQHEANAITINCLGGFYGGHIHAYPCLGFHQLLNDGLIGACECDVRSTASMVALTTLTRGRPGYISDPVVDTARRQIIYAHCVASNRAFGPGGPANPYEILTHSEDRQGASVRSLLPTGYLTTSIQVDQGKREILLHQGRIVGNDPDDRACRTKLCAEPVGDVEKLFTMWDQWGWHRVTFYGDLKEPVRALAHAIGWKLVEEA
ncbi:MAG: hypothetical protein H7A45_00905 [Verrucomicrobiales bacterium]|nr:hypothetical protein [Verrucomicrobiales bacterium]